MKKSITLSIAIYLLTVFAVPQTAFSQVDRIRDDAAKKEIVELQQRTEKIAALENNINALASKTNAIESQIDQLPDEFLMIVGQDSFLLPVKDGKVIFNTFNDIIQDNKGNWPSTVSGWLILLVTLIASGKLTQALTSAKNIYQTLKPWVGNTIFIAGMVGLTIAVGATFLIGQGQFDYKMFAAMSGWTIVIAVTIYEKWIKPKKETVLPIKSEPKTS